MRWSVAVCVQRQRPLRGRSSHARGVPSSHQERRQAGEGLLRRQPPESCHALRSQLVGPPLLVVAAELVDHGGRCRWCHALRRERDRYRPAPRLLRAERVLGDLTGEGLVIDQAHPFKPIQDLDDLTGIEAGPHEPALELPAASGANRQEPESTFMAILASGRASGLA